jgi:hypothetical protein
VCVCVCVCVEGMVGSWDWEQQYGEVLHKGVVWAYSVEAFCEEKKMFIRRVDDAITLGLVGYLLSRGCVLRTVAVAYIVAVVVVFCLLLPMGLGMYSA